MVTTLLAIGAAVAAFLAYCIVKLVIWAAKGHQPPPRSK